MMGHTWMLEGETYLDQGKLGGTQLDTAGEEFLRNN